MRIKLFVAACFLMASRPAHAADIVKFHSEGLPPIVDALDLKAEIVKPSGPGPFPAIIVLHDCAGMTNRDRNWGPVLTSWGYVAIFPDSFGSRGKGNLCLKTEEVTALTRVQDVIGTADYLNTLPYVQKNNIGVLGFSHGGWTITKGVLHDAYWGVHGIKGAVAYYPFCIVTNNNNKIVLPLRILIGRDDDLAPYSRCDDMIKQLKGVDVYVELTSYPNTVHSFDGTAKRQQLVGQGAGGVISKHWIGGNPEAAAEAQIETKQFFDYILKK